MKNRGHGNSIHTISIILCVVLLPGVQGWFGAADAAPRRQVGCWFTIFYDNPAMWDTTKRDPRKIPVVGWGDTLVGPYRSSDPEVLRLQVAAAKKAGIDFLILDMTNGFGNERELQAADTLFHLMSNLPSAQRIKLAVAVGMEFWGPAAFRSYRMNWRGWKEQEEQQDEAIRSLLNRYARRYPSLYYRIGGKPLVVAFLGGVIEAPGDSARKQSAAAKRSGRLDKVPTWKRSDVALRYALSWSATFADTSRGDKGQEQKGMWGWGAKYPQPYHSDAMMVFPGSYNWPMKGPPYALDKEGGRFYIRSWKRVLEKMPQSAIITDWNNWNEETAIEGCIGPDGWKDSHGNPTYDWYLRITAAYSAIFHGHLPDGAYLREDGSDALYHVEGKALRRFAGQVPAHEPVIEVGRGFFKKHGYRVESA